MRCSGRAGIGAAFLITVVGVAAAVALTAGTAAAYGPVFFSSGPGVGAPPGTLGGMPMTPFPQNDPFCDEANQDWANGPNGSRVSFSDAGNNYHFLASCLGGTFGQGGGNNYPLGGDVWCAACFDSNSITLTPQTNTSAIYFYALANACGTWQFQASAGGTYSPVFNVVTACGGPGSNLPEYFGFYTYRGQTLPPITVTQLTGPTDGIMVGEFANYYQKLSKVIPTRAPASAAKPFRSRPGTATP
jgi:hypothetical protein